MNVMDEKEKQEKEIRETKERLAKLEQDKENLVNEIKELRAKKAPEIDATIVEEKAKEIVNQILNEKSGKEATESKVVAEGEFKQKFKEFHPDNDPGGIKYAEFQKTLSRINTSGLKTKEEFAEAFEDAYLVMNKKSIKKDSYSNLSDGNPSLGGNVKEVDGSGLSATEITLIAQQGIDKDKYLKMKAKHPSYVNQLLNRIN